MPRRFSAEELAASAALGELKTEASFEGDIDAWRGYQHFVVVKLTGVPLPPVGDASKVSTQVLPALLREVLSSDFWYSVQE